MELNPINAIEICGTPIDQSQLWLRGGGFPESLLASGDHESFLWRQDFIRTYLTRDVP